MRLLRPIPSLSLLGYRLPGVAIGDGAKPVAAGEGAKPTGAGRGEVAGDGETADGELTL
jgi:hypothetical protein